MTERDVLDRLSARYSQINMGTSPRYLIAEQPNYKQRRRADCIVLDRNWTYDYNGPVTLRRPRYQAVHGFEIKCSRADWLRELEDPSKAQTWKRFCHFWWLVVSDKDIIKDGELPDGWGLLIPRGKGLVAKAPAPFIDPRPLDHEATLALMLAATKTANRIGKPR